MQHIITVEGRSLIRTFLAGATKGAAVCLVSGEHLERMQFIVECGIEYGCQTVTPLSFNSPDCLYTKKS